MIKKSDFKKIDHSWVTSIDGSILSVESHGGVFRLYVYGALAEVAKPEENLIEPTEAEWKVLLHRANELAQIKRIAGR